MKHLRTAEFKPYVIFVKPLIPEKKKNVLKSPVSEEISTPFVSILTLPLKHERGIWASIPIVWRSTSSITGSIIVRHEVGPVDVQPVRWNFKMRFWTPLKLDYISNENTQINESTSYMWICVCR